MTAHYAKQCCDHRSCAHPPCCQPSLGVDVLVDLNFKDHFTLPHATGWYSKLLAALPHDWVGTPAALAPLVGLMCAGMRLCFKQAGIPLPPWREGRAVLSKWVTEVHEDEQLASMPLPDPTLRRLLAPYHGTPFRAAVRAAAAPAQPESAGCVMPGGASPPQQYTVLAHLPLQFQGSAYNSMEPHAPPTRARSMAAAAAAAGAAVPQQQQQQRGMAAADTVVVVAADPPLPHAAAREAAAVAAGQAGGARLAGNSNSPAVPRRIIVGWPEQGGAVVAPPRPPVAEVAQPLADGAEAVLVPGMMADGSGARVVAPASHTAQGAAAAAAAAQRSAISAALAAPSQLLPPTVMADGTSCCEMCPQQEAQQQQQQQQLDVHVPPAARLTVRLGETAAARHARPPRPPVSPQPGAAALRPATAAAPPGALAGLAVAMPTTHHRHQQQQELSSAQQCMQQQPSCPQMATATTTSLQQHPALKGVARVVLAAAGVSPAGQVTSEWLEQASKRPAAAHPNGDGSGEAESRVVEGAVTRQFKPLEQLLPRMRTVRLGIT
jgi:PDDEXK-like family of unknown function